MTLITRRFVQTRNILKLTGLRFHSTNEMVDFTLAKSLFPKLEDVKQQDMTPLNNSVVNRGKYFVGRSETGNLPVYTEYLGGRNKVVTEIKKIRGDPVQLKIDLQERLPFIDKKYWRVVAVSNKIVVKGNYCSEIKKVLSTTF